MSQFERTIPCPHCKQPNEVHTEVADDNLPPGSNDISICWNCRGVSIFIDGEKLRKPTPEEQAKLMKDEELQLILYAMNEIVDR